jgi:transposase
MSHALDKETVNRILHLHKVQGLEARVIAERFGFSSSRVHNVIRRQASSSKRQDYINGERLQHALGWKGSSDFGPKPQASSSKRLKKATIK